MKAIYLTSLYRCEKGPFGQEDPCHDCHDVSCQYHQGFDPDDHVERLNIYLDPEKNKFYGKLNGKRVALSYTKFDGKGYIIEADIK